MYRLVYVSAAAKDLSDQDIKAILDTSQSNNYERYITGFLAHNNNSFMQALEGKAEEVKETYRRILKDDRHHGVVQIVGETITERAFPDWSMNYFRVDSAKGVSMIARRDDPVDSLLPKDMPRDLMRLFTSFLQIESVSV